MRYKGCGKSFSQFFIFNFQFAEGGEERIYIRKYALSSEAARERGLYRPEYVRELLADPNGELTPLRGNKLWQLAVLELWLQSHGIR